MIAAVKAETLLTLVYAAAAEAEVWPTLLRRLAVERAVVTAFMHDGVIDAAAFATGLFVLAPESDATGPAPSAAADPTLGPGVAIALRPARPLPEPIGKMRRQAGAVWARAGFRQPGPPLDASVSRCPRAGPP